MAEERNTLLGLDFSDIGAAFGAALAPKKSAAAPAVKTAAPTGPAPTVK